MIAKTLVHLKTFSPDPEVDVRRLELLDGVVIERTRKDVGEGQILGRLGYVLREHGAVGLMRSAP